MHKKFTTILLLFSFLMWIVPLGAYIQPSQEQKVCNGQRAICLCTNLLKKFQQESTLMNSVELRSGVEIQEAQSYSPPSYLLTETVAAVTMDDFILPLHNYSYLYSFHHLSQIEHVPRFV